MWTLKGPMIGRSNLRSTGAIAVPEIEPRVYAPLKLRVVSMGSGVRGVPVEWIGMLTLRCRPSPLGFVKGAWSNENTGMPTR